MTSNIDPSHPATGSAYTQNVRNNFQAAYDEINTLQADVAAIQGGSVTGLPLTGGTMTGAIISKPPVLGAFTPGLIIDDANGQPSINFNAAGGNWAVNVDNGDFGLSTIDNTGNPLVSIFSVTPTTPLWQHLIPVQFSGVVTLGHDPANPMEAATKQYVDNHVAAAVLPNVVILGKLLNADVTVDGDQTITMPTTPNGYIIKDIYITAVDGTALLNTGDFGIWTQPNGQGTYLMQSGFNMFPPNGLMHTYSGNLDNNGYLTQTSLYFNISAAAVPPALVNVYLIGFLL